MDEVGKAFQRSKNLLEDALEGVLILNNENLIEFINKKGTDILGYPKEEVQGRRIFDFLTDIDQETLSFYLGSPNKNQVNIDKISFIKKNGDIIYLNFRLKPIIIRGNKTKKSIIYIEEKSVQIKNLKAELNKFQNIIEHIPETIYSSLPDDSSTTSFLSKKWEDWTGISVKKYYKDKDLWVKTIHPEDREETLRKYKQAVTNAEEFHLEYRVINKDTGNIVYIRDHGIPVKDSNDILIRYDGVMTNITDLVLTEKKLEKSEKKYRHLFENSPYTIGLLTLDGILLDVNQAANKLMSVHEGEDIIGKHYSEIYQLNKKNKFISRLIDQKFKALRDTEKPQEFEYPVYQTKGGVKWIHAYLTRYKMDDQELIQFILQDITNQKRTQKELQQSEKKFRHLFQNSPFAIGLFTFDGILLDINEAANDLMSAHTIDDLIGMHYRQILSINQKNKPLIDVFERGLRKLQKTREPLEFEFQIIQTKGKTLWLHIYASIFSLEGQELIQFILNDITERKRSEIQLKEAQDKFRTISKQNFVAIVILQDNLFKYFNDEFLRVVGYSREEVNNWTDLEFLKVIHPEDREFVKKQALKKQAGDKDVTQNYEFRGIKKNGEIYWAEIFSKTVNYNGKPADLIITLDITERIKTRKKLKESEKKYRHLFKYSPYAISLFTLDGVLLDVNEGINKFMSKHTKADIIGKHYREFWSFNKKNKPLIKIYDKAFQKLRNTREPLEFEFPIKQSLGGEVWVRIYSSILTIEDQILIQFILQDITERRKTRRELKESEIKYRTLFNNASDSILIHDLKAKILEANKTAINLLGYKRKELLNFSPEDYISQKYVSLIPRRIEEVRKKGQALFESEHITKQGNKIPMEVNLKLIEYNGQPAILNFSRDISDRKRAEKKLQESEEKFRTIAEQSVIGIAIYQREKVEYLNESFAKILEDPYTKLTNSSYNELLKLIHPDDKNKVLTYLRKREGASEETCNFICRIITESNKTKWIEFNSKPISYQNEKAILATIFDLTDQKKAEENLRRINKLKTELLSRTSHELKTPLVSIKGFTNLVLEMKKNEFSDDTIELIEEIKKGANRLELLIKDILDAAKLDFSKETLNKNEANLTKVIQSSIKSLTPLLKSRNLKLDVNIHEKLFLVFDKEKILQVLENLLSNAIKYTPSGGLIKIKTEIKENRCLVSVQDNGIGITPEEMPQLFTQFGKIEHYGSGLDVEIEGSGLGLFISKKIIDLHNGNIWAESEGRNKGSTFYFSLPVD